MDIESPVSRGGRSTFHPHRLTSPPPLLPQERAVWAAAVSARLPEPRGGGRRRRRGPDRVANCHLHPRQGVPLQVSATGCVWRCKMSREWLFSSGLLGDGHRRRKRGDGGDTSPAIKISKYLGGTSPPKIRMKVSNSDYFNGFKLDSFKFHHNFSIVVAILDRTKPIHVRTYQCHKNTCHSTDPTRKRPLKCVPPARNVWRRPW